MYQAILVEAAGQSVVNLSQYKVALFLVDNKQSISTFTYLIAYLPW